MFKYVALLVMAAALGILVSACARIYPPAGSASGPTPTPVIRALVPPHGDVGQADCAACHQKEEKFVAVLQSGHPVPIPPGFKGTSREACGLCHEVGAGKEIVVSGGGKPGNACNLCHDVGQSHTVGPSIPHPLEGMKECLVCHTSGTTGVSQVPTNHAGYTIEKCHLCHTTVTKVVDMTNPPTAGKAIPHSLEGMKECLACHAGGAQGVTQTPANHKGYTADACTLCHAPATE